MFRIRRVYDDVLPNDRAAVAQVQEILRSQFGALSEADINKLALLLQNPLKFRFRTILHIAKGERRVVKGFALMMHAPDPHFSYLDFLAEDPKRMGGGTGGPSMKRSGRRCGKRLQLEHPFAGDGQRASVSRGPEKGCQPHQEI